MRLVEACDGNQYVVGAVLNISQPSVAQRLGSKRARPAWRRLRNEMGTEFGRARRLRWWWRRRLKQIGIDPHTLPITDPLWHACFTLPKGELARREIPRMRDDLRARGAPAPDDLSTDERVEEFCARVEAAKREHFAVLRKPNERVL